MAIEKRFRETLNSNIQTIKESLVNKIRDKFEKIRDEKLDIDSIKTLTETKANLEEDISEARKNLDQKINKLQDEYQMFRSDKQKEIEATQDLIDKELPVVSQYSGYDDSVSDKAKDIIRLAGFFTKYNGSRSGKMYKLEEEALEEIADSKEVRSYYNFEKIKEHTNNLFNMAATNVEARTMLLAFQNKNWAALGVNLPTLNMTEAFSVSDDGEIVMKALGDGSQF